MARTYRWLNAYSQDVLDTDYLSPGETVEARLTTTFEAAGRRLGIPDFAERIHANFEKGWYSLASPIWTNYGNDRGLPISCYGSYTSDKLSGGDPSSILGTHTEIGVMSQHGGGTSAYFGNVRGRGKPITGKGKTCGSVHFAQMFDTLITIVSQGSVRRGQCALWWPIDHDDIEEVLTIKSDGSKIQQLSYGLTVKDAWMQEMIDGDAEKRRIWAKLITARKNTGYPYVLFSDTVNNNTVDVYKDLGMTIESSNLCTEVLIPSSIWESFVCCLSSMNVLYFDEWKDTDAVELLVYFLDTVLSEFIEKASKIPELARAVRFAERHRSIGIGWLGWHSLLKSKMIAFESMEAKRLNVTVAKTIHAQAYAASRKMADEYGEPELLKGYGRRHSVLLAIAPTKSSSFIIGQVSEGIQPDTTNYRIEDNQKGKFVVRDPFLKALLAEKGLDNDETWESILKNRGSVQHLVGLTRHEKDVFKTFIEISQMELVQQAAQRQPYIDQGQSLNFRVHKDADPKQLNKLLIEGWKLGIKTFYYQKGVNAAQEFARDNIADCKSCEA